LKPNFPQFLLLSIFNHRNAMQVYVDDSECESPLHIAASVDSTDQINENVNNSRNAIGLRRRALSAIHLHLHHPNAS
jgi:hypothetical protein